MGISPLDEKFRGFGFNVIECDGHDYEELDKAFKNAEETKGKPTVIIAKTVKGRVLALWKTKQDGMDKHLTRTNRTSYY